MKRLWLAASLLAAATASAQWQSVLTEENVLWSANGEAYGAALELKRCAGEVTAVVRVPGTEDVAMESHVRLAYDNASRALFVLWRHDEEVRAVRHAAGRWSEPIVLARGPAFEGLQLVVTRAAGVTLLHGAWWNRDTAEYALLAFDERGLLSKFVAPLDQLANLNAAAGAIENTGKAAHPPLAMVRAGEGVDVAYGASRSTAITRLTLIPEPIGGDARMWRPSGRSGRRTDPAGLVSSTTAAVQSFIIDGRVVLYTPDAKFRYVVFENGRWTPIRMLALDDSLTSDTVLRELRRSILEHGSGAAPAAQ